MDPITISILGGVIIAGLISIADWRARKSPSGRIKDSQKRVTREAQKISRDFKNKVEKNVRNHRK